ncbi:MAG: AMP-binding protein [Polyangiaceae bacterium]|nr:AMP-binding protein [Polyangiaceae bacterium]
MSPWRLAGDALAALGDRIALEGQGARVSYAELAARAASVWRALRRVGVMPGAPAALLSSGRAHDEAVGLTGILTSGAVAVPLDATAPPHRLASIMAARGCSALVLDEKALPLADAIEAELARMQANSARVILDAGGRVIRVSGGVAPDAIARSMPDPVGSIAGILHTSGSTGVPKPVPITWAGLDAFMGWAIEQFSITPSDRVLRVAELIFDLAWFDHLATLRAGATLVTMSRRELAAGTATLAALRALAPTVIYGVPSLFMKLSAALPEGREPLQDPAPRAVLYAGEVFPPRELKAFAERVPGASIWNLYGPTETNVCTFHPIDRAALDGERETPIGSACPYARCSLIAEDGRVIEGPGTGELLVEGPTTVGGGPFATRDRVERGADGLFYFRGRMDRMVKIRGYRVEPGEVEAVLGMHPAVRQAAVLVYADARIGKTLRAFVEIRGQAAPVGEREFRIFLAERLPSYMVPERVSALDELPRTSTGKIDYRALFERPS